MLYAIINKEKGEAYGIKPRLHKVIGERMIVNENELRLVNPDIHEAAKVLGGAVMTQNEVFNELKRSEV